MDRPVALSPSETKADIGISVQDTSIVPNPNVTNYPSPRPSMLKYSGGLELTPSASITNSGCHGTLGCETHITPETKPQTLKYREYMQFIALCSFNYLHGWNDGTNGPLLPRIQRVYGIGYAVVSLIFVFACLGFVTGALLNIVLDEKLGFGKVVVLGSLLQVVGYSIECFAPPFPVFLFAYFINGTGLAFQSAQSFGYVASFKENAETKMSIFTSAWASGALSSPLLATQFSHLDRWSFHYLTCLGITSINAVSFATVFRLKRQEECLAQIGISSAPKQPSEHSHFREIFNLRGVHPLAFFTLLFVGVETTTGGWIVTYIIDIRRGGVSSGYVSTGYFAGMVAGGVGLLWVNKKLGERLALIIYAICAIGLELVIWFVPSLVGDAVAVAIIGVLTGPMYPLAMNQCRRLFPPRLLTGAIGWVSGSGQAGSALVPFMAGAIASKAGIAMLQPVLVGILGSMTLVWILVPKAHDFMTQRSQHTKPHPGTSV